MTKNRCGSHLSFSESDYRCPKDLAKLKINLIENKDLTKIKKIFIKEVERTYKLRISDAIFANVKRQRNSLSRNSPCQSLPARGQKNQRIAGC